MSSPPGNFDPQTLADRQAQRCIVENLRAIYGSQLRIVGEEGELGGAMGGFFQPPAWDGLGSTSPKNDLSGVFRYDVGVICLRNRKDTLIDCIIVSEYSIVFQLFHHSWKLEAF